MSPYRKALFDPTFNDNSIALQILGICSALAVTTKLETSVVMKLSVIFVTGFSSLSVSMIFRIRHLRIFESSSRCPASRLPRDNRGPVHQSPRLGSIRTKKEGLTQ